jgi:predicted Zn-dependent peptidase
LVPAEIGRAQQAADRAAAGVQTPAEQLVTEMDVKGLKVLFKRRAGSQTVAAGLFFKGGARNVTAGNAGVELLALQVATEATTSFPREKLRRELASTGTSLGAGMTLDYSVLSLACTRQAFDRSWAIYADAILKPSFLPEDVDRVKTRMMAGELAGFLHRAAAGEGRLRRTSVPERSARHRRHDPKADRERREDVSPAAAANVADGPGPRRRRRSESAAAES